MSPVIAPSVQVTPVGSGSETWTSVAEPLPVFVTVTSKPIGSPALTGPAGLAVLVMPIWAQSTSIAPASELLPCWATPSFVAATVAVLFSGPQSFLSVRPETWTVADAPEAMSPKAQSRTWEPTAPVTSQLALSSDQSMPPGSGSWSVTLFAQTRAVVRDDDRERRGPARVDRCRRLASSRPTTSGQLTTTEADA